ncbi:metallophosphoesterase [Zavarzinia sp.]|uniref:metallophosphoesterase n=1 Tax=Zavarzinia sp. TaxID=2027920 RepID=UPI00356B38DF
MSVTVTEHDWQALPVAAAFKGHVVGDIHGVSSLLRRALDIVGRRGGGALVTLGDYIDRGPDSLGVLDLLIEAERDLDLVPLAGNHDWFMWWSVKAGRFAPYWMQNGGHVILREIRDDLNFHSLAAVVGPARCAFLGRLNDYHRVGDLVFVHAGLPPWFDSFAAMAAAVPGWKQTPAHEPEHAHYQWIRADFLNADRNPGGVFVVHGHTIHPEVTLRPHRLSIDLGSYTSGRIALVEIDHDRFRPTVIEDDEQPARWRRARAEAIGL